MGKLFQLFSGMIIGILGYYLFPHMVHYFSLNSNEHFAFSTKHSSHTKDLGYHARYRADWTTNQSFFHWYNYFIQDADTLDLTTIAINMSGLTPESRVVAFVAQTRDKDLVEQDQVVLEIPYQYFHDHGNSTIEVNSPEVYILQKFSDIDNTVHFYAERNSTHHRIPTNTTTTDPGNFEDFRIDLQFTIIHGAYVNADSEVQNTTECNIGGSIVFGTNLIVSGTTKYGNKDVTHFNTTPKFRAYGGSSYGCTLPQGRPAFEFPWSWSWIVVPSSSGNPDEDISVVFADARFESPIGPIYGTHFYIGLENRTTITARSALLNHHRVSIGNDLQGTPRRFHQDGTPIDDDIINTSEFKYKKDSYAATSLPLFSSASDGNLFGWSISHDHFFNATDNMGSATLPSSSYYMVETETLRVYLSYTNIRQYYRLPVDVFNTIEQKVTSFSDFRALNSIADLIIWDKKTTQKGTWNWSKLAFDDDVIEYTVRHNSTNHHFNSCEFAYQAPVKTLPNGSRTGPMKRGEDIDVITK